MFINNSEALQATRSGSHKVRWEQKVGRLLIPKTWEEMTFEMGLEILAEF